MDDKLFALMNSVPSGIAVYRIGERFECLYCNDELCRILGYSKEEIVGSDHSDTRHVHPQDRIKVEDAAKKLVGQNKRTEMEFRVLRRDNVYIWIEFRGECRINEDGEVFVYCVYFDISNVKRQEKQLVRQANLDTLTGIYNREAFYQITEERILSLPEEEYVIVVWDIQNFKVINDTFGFRTGDVVLIMLAGFLKSRIHGIGTYARLESDHFATCLTKQAYLEYVRNILDDIPKNIDILPVNYPIIMHIGVYMVEDRSMSIGLMCDRAHLAIDTISKNYVQRIAYYTEEMRNHFLDEQELERRMETALNNHEFYVDYQPIYDAQTGKPMAAEALVRWNHPKRGIIAPGIFIPIFEKNGYITKLDRYVWEEVCKELREQKELGRRLLPVSVNVSRMNLYDDGLCDFLLELLQKYQLNTDLIKLEITESSYKENPIQLIDSMQRFREAGFHVLMDDFGSGFSSLNMLKDVPVDTLKIDMQFIRELEASERAGNILTNIVRMAKQLSTEVVAEGVETETQYRFLTKIGCNYIQGFYFSKPLSKEHYKNVVSEMDNEDIEENVAVRPRILVVDDSRFARKIIRDVLMDLYDIVESVDGQEAYEYLHNAKEHVDLVITDIMMPRMDGFELLNKISKSALYSGMPVVVITSIDDTEKEIKALNSGAVDVIVKPFNSVAVRQRIQNILKIAEVESIKRELSKIHDQDN